MKKEQQEQYPDTEKSFTLNGGVQELVFLIFMFLSFVFAYLFVFYLLVS